MAREDITEYGICKDCNFFNPNHKRLTNRDKEHGLGICMQTRMRYDKVKPTDYCEYWQQGDEW